MKRAIQQQKQDEPMYQINIKKILRVITIKGAIEKGQVLLLQHLNNRLFDRVNFLLLLILGSPILFSLTVMYLPFRKIKH